MVGYWALVYGVAVSVELIIFSQDNNFWWIIAPSSPGEWNALKTAPETGRFWNRTDWTLTTSIITNWDVTGEDDSPHKGALGPFPGFVIDSFTRP